MSIHMTLIFGVLLLEMASLSLLVLPLPHSIRKALANFLVRLWHTVQFRVTVWVCSGLIAVLFIDAAQRSIKYPVQRDVHDEANVNPNPASSNHLTHGYNELSSSEYLVKKFYNQRNFYLTGIVLYLELAIPTVVNILRKIIKWDDQLTLKKSGKTVDIDDLTKQLERKERDVATLKKQIIGLQKSYNDKADQKNATGKKISAPASATDVKVLKKEA